MKYIVENWVTEEIIKIFNSEEERQKWINDNCISFSDGCYINDTETKISIYETRWNNGFKYTEGEEIIMDNRMRFIPGRVAVALCCMYARR